MTNRQNDLVAFIQKILDRPLQPYQVAVLSLLEKPNKNKSRRASSGRLALVDMNRSGIRAISTTAAHPGAISVGRER